MIEDILIEYESNSVILNKVLPINCDKNSLLNNIEHFFHDLKYNNVSRLDKSITASNGKINKNGWFNNPTKWYNVIKIKIDNDSAILDVCWSFENQIITNNEKIFIVEFLQELVDGITNNKMPTNTILDKINKTTYTGRLLTIFISLGILISFFISMSLTIKFDSFYWVVICFPIGIWLSFKLSNLLIKKRFTTEAKTKWLVL